jgi:hypothetical protein
LLGTVLCLVLVTSRKKLKALDVSLEGIAEQHLAVSDL